MLNKFRQSAVTRTSEIIPVARGHLTPGAWQGIFLFEHRRAPHSRLVDVVAMGI
jgi:thiamine phosphate synthase YjbQ (UPF0047 family)